MFICVCDGSSLSPPSDRNASFATVTISSSTRAQAAIYKANVSHRVVSWNPQWVSTARKSAGARPDGMAIANRSVMCSPRTFVATFANDSLG